MIRKNNEGYPDPTAATAIQEADKTPEVVEMYLKMVRDLARVFGLEIVGKFRVRDKKTKRIYP